MDSEFAGMDPQQISVVLPPASDVAPGYVFLTASQLEGYQNGPMIVDEDRELIWFLPVAHGSTNLQVQQYRGEPVLTWWEGRNVAGYGKGYYPIYDSSYRRVTTVRAGNGLHGDLHEFVLTPEGTALFTAYRVERADLSAVGGARDGKLLNCFVQEVDVATGKVLFQWDAAKHVAFDLSYAPVPTSSSAAWDFFHLNSICVDTDGNLVISSRHTWAVYKLDRSTGTVIWRLNGKESDFTMGPRTRFYWQHDARTHPGGMLTLFDDGAGITAEEKESRGLKLLLDTASMKATFVEQYLPDPSLLATSQGSMQLLEGGNVFVGWGDEPYFSEYTAGATLLYDARLPLHSHSYRAFKFTWTGKPASDPEASVARLGAERLAVLASWNGATEVASWDVLAGLHAGDLQLVASSPRLGFVTTMDVTGSARYVVAEARDASGAVLGRSKTVVV